MYSREYAYDLKNNKEIINYSLEENISFIINKGRLDRYIFEDTLYLEMDDGNANCRASIYKI